MPQKPICYFALLIPAESKSKTIKNKIITLQTFFA